MITRDDLPVWLQIKNTICDDIMQGRYHYNDRLPSVREFAIMYRINPNTVQKALGELENDGLIETRGTNGKFVTCKDDSVKNLQNETVKKLVSGLCKTAMEYGMEREEVIDKLREEWGHE